MKFNDESLKTGICQDSRSLLGLSVNDTISLPNSDLARTSNVWQRVAKDRIWSACADWEYDDKNYGDLPVATTDLVDGQEDYELPSTAQTIERVEVLDADGDAQLLIPINKELVKSEAMTEMFSSDGMPEYYDMVGRSIILYPTPATGNVTTTDGLRIYVSRDVETFNATTTTREPGFNENFHRFISYGNALDYSIGKGMVDKISYFESKMTEMERNMKEFYSKQHGKDFKARIIPRNDNSV
jgi:hypothetical protein